MYELNDSYFTINVSKFNILLEDKNDRTPRIASRNFFKHYTAHGQYIFQNRILKHHPPTPSPAAQQHTLCTTGLQGFEAVAFLSGLEP